jgi:CRP/FNR family cyclic AMP-dependent transcriptional regulator
MPDNLDSTLRFLGTVPMFRELDERQLKHIGKRFIHREYAPGEPIVEQGKLGIGLFIIESGRAEVVRQRIDDTSSVVDTLGPTNFFGELSLLDEEPRTASVIAAETTHCLVLTQLDFMTALEEDVTVPIAILKELARRYRRAIETM